MPGPMPTPIGRRWTRRSARTKRLEPWPLFADENFPQQVVAALRARGHDVLTAYEPGTLRDHRLHSGPRSRWQATRIDQVLGGGDAAGQLLRVNRPPR